MLFEKKLTPFGMLLKGEGGLPTLDKLKVLAQKHKVLVLRGFEQLDKAYLQEYCQQHSQLLEWHFGPVMEMEVDEETKNYLFTHGDVPLHWDGAFYQEPLYLFFHCIKAPTNDSGGETFFVSTEKVIDKLTVQERTLFSQLKIRYVTEKKAHYGGEILCPLMAKHPQTGKSILKFAEPVTDRYLNPVSVEIINSTKSPEIIAQLQKKCYEKGMIYYHQWQQGDYLIADNFSLLHGRNPFKKNSPRHLRRLQLMS